MRRKLASLAVIVAFALPAIRLRAVVDRGQIELLFRPFLAEQVTLAPDGRHVAYTEHARNELTIVIMALEEPYAKVRIAVADDEGLAFSKEKERVSLRFLRWATSNRLVFAPQEELAGPAGARQNHSAPILAVDADGKNPRKLIDGPDFAGTISIPGNLQNMAGDTDVRPRFSRIVGFPVGDRDHLLVQALGAVFLMPVQVVLPTTLFKVDVHTGKHTELGDEFLAGGVGYDRQGRSRISYAQPLFATERPFALLGAQAPRLNEPWLGPLAGRFLISAQNYFGERAYPLGFDGDPDVLYVASNVGRDTFGIYALNLKTKQRTDIAFQDPHIDLAPLEPSYPAAQLIFDDARGRLAGVRSPGPQPVSLWRDPELSTLQGALERRFPQRTVEILEWSDARTAFLVRITGGNEPGRYFVFNKEENLPLEFLRRAPWLDAASLHATEFFEFDPAPDVHLTGYVTLPRTSRLNPPPAVICFADGFPAQPQAEFDREAQVLAGMGLMVIRLNHRGVGGFGRRHRDAILAGVDRVPVEDALATVRWIAARHPVDRRRIATMGTGFGGYLAVRALQLHPEFFRCAVACNAPLNPGAWVRPEITADMGVRVDFEREVNRAFLSKGTRDLASLSVLDHPETVTHPVFLLVEAPGDGPIGEANGQLRDRLRRAGDEVDYVEVNSDFAAGLPAARARAYAQLEEFFNLNLYDYKVKVGETREVK